MLYLLFRFLLRVLYRLLFRLEARGLHHIPKDGPVILASNHISNLDPPTIGVLVPRKVNFMAKEELFKVPVFGPLIRAFGAFPVKRGGVSKDAIKSAITLLKEGNVLGIFPEGSRKTPGAAKKGAAMIAVRSGATIVPVAIVGGYRLFRKTRVCYGEPLDLTAIIHESSPDMLEQVTDAVMERIGQLAAQNR
ncbi:1-acyl-sn-glycerol-3-phosphate acyltransferase [Paenibacillus sp. MY03]|jgi:1-acyl-sn-glycerol-3-phosphate acyltransferase|uniref:1-acyl-sn-glycerol-3-phosphate acyltransferase n=1 Tax=Paenibacillus agaridevorans TaxID=171404 RepID=A0A2R5F6H3_9BACL|nr:MULTISPECIES: lysophospholipid acyltransferase family protein [Paenibacillus]OUS77392.1 1-acyl-sn-glycerol-3-phosphate acyltransferase [Paenibacillus sp. MY03]GBG12054.1 1-acyl-sn-glycerol-3-phosphate acyltransferase [Paenibacillus agaridevorans]